MASVRTEGHLGDVFKYSEAFNPGPTRALLGLDGHRSQADHFPPEEVLRWANLLLRGDYITGEEIVWLGMKAAASSEE